MTSDPPAYPHRPAGELAALQTPLTDGIVSDAERLRADVRAMVDEQQAAGARSARTAAEAAQRTTDPDTP